MHHDIVDYLRGSEHEETVEIKVSLAAAASPASTLFLMVIRPYVTPTSGAK